MYKVFQRALTLTKRSKYRLANLVVTVAFCGSTTVAQAVTCSDTGGQFEAWKPGMAELARSEGVGERGIRALMATNYSNATISADRK